MHKLAAMDLLLESSHGLGAEETPLADRLFREDIGHEILEDRLDNLLPKLMEREGIDMWI